MSFIDKFMFKFIYKQKVINLITILKIMIIHPIIKCRLLLNVYNMFVQVSLIASAILNMTT